MLNSFMQAMANLIYPPPSHCFYCNKKLDGRDHYGICLGCVELILESRYIIGFCQRCGHFGIKANQCTNCRPWSGYLDSCRAVGPYTAVNFELIKALKYGNKRDLAKVSGYLM